MAGQKYVYKDFTGLYYAGASAGWMNLGGSAWVKDIERAEPLSMAQAKRVAKTISGEIIELKETP